MREVRFRKIYLPIICVMIDKVIIEVEGVPSDEIHAV